MIQYEWKRCFRAKGWKMAAVLALALAVGEFFGYRIFYKQYMHFLKAGQALGDYLPSLYEGSLNGDIFTMFNMMYYYFFPLLAALPFGCSFFQDEELGSIKYIYALKPKEKYLTAKYLVVFFSGGMAAVLPAVFSFALNALYVPAVVPHAMAMQSGIIDALPLSEFYYSRPWIYFGVYLLLEMLAGGFLSTLALIAGFYAKNVLLVLFTPMICYIMSDYILTEMGLQRYSLRILVNPVAAGAKEQVLWQEMFLEVILLATATFLLFYLAGRKRERIV
mgnify:CR=1 FL=1